MIEYTEDAEKARDLLKEFQWINLEANCGICSQPCKKWAIKAKNGMYFCIMCVAGIATMHNLMSDEIRDAFES
jgi:hypothetical protein